MAKENKSAVNLDFTGPFYHAEVSVARWHRPGACLGDEILDAFVPTPLQRGQNDEIKI
jgi:hypothetical protein